MPSEVLVGVRSVIGGCSLSYLWAIPNTSKAVRNGYSRDGGSVNDSECICFPRSVNSSSCWAYSKSNKDKSFLAGHVSYLNNRTPCLLSWRRGRLPDNHLYHLLKRLRTPDIILGCLILASSSWIGTRAQGFDAYRPTILLLARISMGFSVSMARYAGDSHSPLQGHQVYPAQIPCGLI